jgi:hypothetical protein
MHRTPHDWQVALACPACGRRSQVSVSVLRSVLRCPHCRKRSIVSVNAVQSASLREIAQRSHSAFAPRRQSGGPRRRIFRSGPMVLVSSTACLLIVLTAWAICDRAGISSAIAPNDQELLTAARGFATAWLNRDRIAAEQFVAGSRRAEFTAWWNYRLAVLGATFGPDALGEVSTVEIEKRGIDWATVRVRLRVGGRPQIEVFQWHRSADQWWIRLANLAPSAGDDNGTAHPP